jgi:DNA-binding transcriptional MerR regulator
MLERASFTLNELAQRSGFDRRTIVYYIQIDLLPKVGRRGPNTRYPEECLDRLRFIRDLRVLQDRGHLTHVSLGQVRRLFGALDPHRLRGIVDGCLEPAELEPLFAAPDTPPQASPETPPAPQEPRAAAAPPTPPTSRPLPRYGLADADVRRRFAVDPSPATGTPAVPGSTEPEEAPGGEDLGELLRTLETSASLTRTRVKPGASEQWTEVPVTSRIFLSVRGLAEEDLPLADAIGRALKRLLRR